VFRALLPLAALALAAGCNRPRFDTPTAAYESFARAIQKGDYDVAWSALSSGTQRLLSDRAREISAASGGSVREDPAALFFVERVRAPPVSEIKLAREEGDSAALAVTAGGVTREVRMVKERGGWRIDSEQALRH
jgi:hypothetical protein